MHKRRTYKRSDSSVWRNANSRISESASQTIIELLEGVEWGNEFSVEYLKSEYLSKYCDEGLTPADQRRANAVKKWLDTEDTNLATNARLADMDPGYNILPRVPYSAFCKFARRIISNVLGPLRDSIVSGSFSGGASTSRRRTESHPAQKFCNKADATEAAFPFLDIVWREGPLLRQYGVFANLNETRGAVLFTVPKKTDIDRCACKEPDFNMYLQKGVGLHIRRRLQRFGINLNDQAINRRLAHAGSLSGELATLDLSSASDTITIEAVRALLPTDWFLYLNDIRSQEVLVDGRYHRTHMFSSMGNGFTFELESLIFWALARTVCYFEGISGIVSVYGDDIIVPSRAFDMVTWALSVFGFTVNESKSFATGPFRESCGGHYHEGEDVTPFYLKRRPTHLTDVIRVANQFRRWAMADPIRRYSLPAIYNVWRKLADMVPPEFWGGYDLSVDTILVSPGGPIAQLVRVTSPKKLPGSGAYLHWHNSNRDRTVGPEEGARDPLDTQTKVCRARRAKRGAQHCEELFWEELLH